MLKIVHLGKYHWSYPGGLERYLGQMHLCYKRPKYDVSVDYVVFKDGIRSSVETVNGSTIFSMGVFAKVRSAPIYGPNRSMRELLGRQYDIIQMHHPNPSMHILYGLLKRKNPGAKKVLFWHSDISRQRLLKRLYKPWQERLMDDADRIIVTSPNYLASSTDLAPVRHKCEHLPFGRQARVAAPAFPYDREILAVGRLVYYKGFEYLIDAMAHPDTRQYNLTIIGEGAERRNLEGRIRYLRLGNRVRIIDHVSEEELEDHYRGCDVFVLPSIDRAEAFGIVLLEAMSYGKPVITTSIRSGTDFIVQDGVNGYVVQPRSAIALCGAILKVMKDGELRMRMGEASLNRIENDFSVDVHFDRLHAIYKSLVSSQ